MTTEILLTLTEVAQKLRIPVATLRHWRANYYGPRGFKVGRRVLFTESEVNRWVAEQQHTCLRVSRVRRHKEGPTGAATLVGALDNHMGAGVETKPSRDHGQRQ